ncbi:signal recognition particle-docking protein FtsY [Microbulbifer celer]|uniref:Signal recognition particle receptor FtsY n=1 Tax=Microbulbifer celer TaxID=435905 RepID=A0ABW3U8Y7_9GAMM|nr:signal recognition particle-docking protein FtsY [Microbulbifer celer]UFN57137.1 signal recognition particle-docking protein FtsY [Microbulbifer celer]
MIFDFLRKKKPKPDEAAEPVENGDETPETGESQAQDGEVSAESAPAEAPAEPEAAEAPDESADKPDAVSDAEPVAPAEPEQEGLKSVEPPQPEAEPVPAPQVQAAAPQVQEKPKKEGFFARIRRGLSRTSSQFAEGMGNLFLGAKEIDEDLMEELETQLLMADVGLDATTEIIDRLTDRVSRRELSNGEALYGALQEELAGLLDKVEAPLAIDPGKKPFVILVVGVNGVGKTTTIGKLAHRYLNEGKSVMLAAGDTFRAAAVEQLQVWGQRHNVPVVAQHTGADSASVIFDAIQSAQSRGVDVVIADTAGRLHNKSNLMEELSKVRRVMGKLDDSAPHETLLVLDAGTGQNALSQAETFKDSAGVSGLVLTKLDGTAKGGVIFALAQRLGIPVRFIGVGEQSEDLQPFVAKDFVAALFNRTQD